MINTIKNKIRMFFHHWFTMMNPPVFFGAALTILAIILFGALWTQQAGKVFNIILEFITRYFGWYYVIIVFAFFVFVIWLALSKYGKIRLGGDKSRPEFSRFSWFSMLFAAGMGMGLIFWGVAEPVMHYTNPPTAEPESLNAMKEGLRFSFFHWGLHPWAIYIAFGLGIAYFHFRHKLPLAPRSLLYPILGKRTEGWIGHVTDIFCTIGTLLGVATSLGLGAMQINSGIHALTDLPNNTTVQVWIIGIITVVATVSTVTGISKGIRFLSMTNVAFMFLLLLFVFFTGPTLYQLNTLVNTLGSYFADIIDMSLWIDLRKDNNWQNNWTLFYWGWWISWSPFVGIFIARISKGRTIREFILNVLLVPALVTFFWLSVFGGTALYLEMTQGVDIASVVNENVAMSLHALLKHLPISQVTQWVGVALIIIFFITSSDSGSYVDDMVTSGGHPNPPAAQRAFWGISEGATAAVLVVAGGLSALQTASISAGLPQSLLVIACCFALVKALRNDIRNKPLTKSN
jgi:choline/glycine/proline betaine transport protein